MKAPGEIKGRKCYDHLGGKLGSVLLDFFLQSGWIVPEEGRATVYVITEKGKVEFEKLGVQL